MELIKTHRELKVYQNSFNTALEIYAITKKYPIEERYSLTDQIRRSSRSVCANLAEAFRKRRYKKVFISKLSDAETEAAESQVWLEFSFAHKYIPENIYKELIKKYDLILSQIITMINQPEKWSY